LKPLVTGAAPLGFPGPRQRVDHSSPSAPRFNSASSVTTTRFDINLSAVDIRRFARSASRRLLSHRVTADTYKRIDLAIEAFNRLGLPLSSPAGGVTRPPGKAGQTERSISGRVPDADLPDLMARCKAFMFPGRGRLRHHAVEAQASDAPSLLMARAACWTRSSTAKRACCLKNKPSSRSARRSALQHVEV